MKTIGIKLADGSFYPVLEDNTPSEKQLELTTAHNNQTKVMVDLYRSATCSMEDAEYVDSLQIENLIARPNGETDIKFSVSLDEDNQLSAKIVDPETGNESNTTITLVSRTLEERLITDEYNINDTNDDKGAGAAIAGAAVAGGLLAAAAALRDKNEETEVAEEEPEVEISEESVAEEPVFDETAVDEPVIEETIPDEEVPAEEIAETPAEENSEAPVEESPLPDMDFDLPEETSETSETFETSDETISEDAGLPDMDFNLPEDTESETTSETETNEEFNTDTDETIVSEDSIPDDETISDDDSFSFEDTDNTISSDETITDTSTSDDIFASDETITEDNSELPDMDFDLPDDTDTNENPELPDDFFNTEDEMKDPTFDTETPAATGLNFDGLYDEETERGTPAQSDADEVKKKTKVPVIICIICAIICIIATALILFIIPSKYNLLTKKSMKENAVAIEEPTPTPEPVIEQEPEPEPAVPEAKEDEIIIIEKAEEVVPAQPPVAEETPKETVYKIKWGDTLWDIADTYYKNPWKYKYIARYNGIKNPDYIISGTKIIIPAK